MSSSSRLTAALVDRGPGAAPSSLYVHVPFCRDRCSYCAFPTLADDASLHRSFVEAILAETGTADPAGPLSTIYFGGGTPALLATERIARLLDAFASRFSVTPNAELTLEANPANITRESLRDWAALGFRRLSIGVQTFRDDTLAELGRLHDGAESRRALREVADHWAASWSVDLLVGWRGERTGDVLRDLAALEEFAPPHVSVYGLTIEPLTQLAWQQARGGDVIVSRPRRERFDDIWSDWLGERGYERYEISNFARTGHRSRHNQAYWSNRSYIGLGPGAASSVHPYRWTNRADVGGYVAAAARRHGVRAHAERIEPLPRLMESLAIGLRIREGIALAELDARFSSAWRGILEVRGAELLREGVLVSEGGRLAIRRDDFIKVDTILSDLVTRMASDEADRDTPAGSPVVGVFAP